MRRKANISCGVAVNQRYKALRALPYTQACDISPMRYAPSGREADFVRRDFYHIACAARQIYRNKVISHAPQGEYIVRPNRKRKSTKEKTIKELAVELTIETTATCDNIKGRAVFVNQLLRSCSSIGANSYEAKYAQSKADFIHKMEIALKECYETDYWLEILFKVGAMSAEAYQMLSRKCGTIRRKLIASITTAKENSDKP